MKNFLLAFVSILLGGSMALFLLPSTQASNQPEGEGYGVNMSSRKYYEYLRHHDPETGEVNPNWRKDAFIFGTRMPKKQYDRSVTWNLRGPINKGGRTRALAIDRLNENIMLAGSVTGGMWRTTNAGADWYKVTAPEQIHSVSSVVQDPRPGHESTWYFGTGEESYGVVSGTSFTSLFSGDGMFKSTDNGQTWTQLASTASGTPQNILQNGSYDFIWNIVIDHTNLEQEVVYAAVFNGVIRSLDGGETWEQVLGFTSSPSQFCDVMMTPSGILYATLGDNGTTGGGFYRSENGTDWNEISPLNTEIQNLRRTVLTYNPQNENEIYFLGESINNSAYPVGHFLYKYTYISGDGSGTNGTWENRSANLPDDPCTLFIGADFDFGTFRSQFSFDLCIAHHPTAEDVLYIGGINIHRSTDAFATDNNSWIGGYRCNQQEPTNYSYPNHHSDQHLMVFSHSDPDVMFSVNDGGLYRTDDNLADSVAWNILNHNYITTQFYTVAMEQGQATSDFVFGGMQDNGTWITHSADASQNWKEVHADDGSFCALPQEREFIITSSQEGRVYKKTINAEGQLTGTERIDMEDGPTYLFINPLLLDPWNQNEIFIAGNKSIWYRPNVSSIPVTGNYTAPHPQDEWILIEGSNVPTTAGVVTCLDKALIDNTIIFYGTSQGRIYRLDDMYGTPIKTNVSSPDFPTNGYVSCVTMNDFNPNEVIACFSQYNRRSIFHTTDGGVTWTDIGGNLEENEDGTGAGPAVYWVEIYPGETAQYFAATSAGLYSTSLLDGANTVWEMEGAETIGNVIVNMVKVRPYDGMIAVGTHGNGIYTGQLPPVEAASVENINALKKEIKAFPNPFTQFVQLPFNLTQRSTVQLEIYDLQGRRVYSDKQTFDVGHQTLYWYPDGTINTGTYVYQLTIGKKTHVGKVIYRK